MILKQVALRKLVVLYTSASTRCCPSQLIKAVISRNVAFDSMNRIEPTVQLERNIQESSDTSNHVICDTCILKLSNNVRWDDNRYSTADSKNVIQSQSCSTRCSKIQNSYRKQAVKMHASIHKHAILCVFRDPLHILHRNYCNKSSGGKGEDQSWEFLVNYDKLSPQEVKIHEKHKTAVQNGKLKYTDPQTGYHVMTRLAHLQRGDCCGNACRHCPYSQEGVKDPNMKKTYNTAFYV